MPTETEMKDGSAKGGIENTSDPVRRTDERLRGEVQLQIFRSKLLFGRARELLEALLTLARRSHD